MTIHLQLIITNTSTRAGSWMPPSCLIGTIIRAMEPSTVGRAQGLEASNIHVFSVIGEYAVTSTNASDVLGSFETGRLRYPTLQGASAEAAFMTGMERNSDVVYASACTSSPQDYVVY